MEKLRSVRLALEVPDFMEGERKTLMKAVKRLTILSSLMYSPERSISIVDVEWLDGPDTGALLSLDFVNSVEEVGMGGASSIYMVILSHPAFFSDLMERAMTEYLCFMEFPIVITESGASLRIVSSQENLQSILDILGDSGLKFEVTSVRDYIPAGPEAFKDLTYLQYRYLKTAHERGFFDIPKRVDVRGLARLEGISHNTLSQHLRKGTAKVMDRLFG